MASGPRSLTAKLGGADGSVVDGEGYLWNARWGGGCVIRFTPDGQIDRVIEVPGVTRVSCPAFGGADMKTLYLTTAREGMTRPRPRPSPPPAACSRSAPMSAGLSRAVHHALRGRVRQGRLRPVVAVRTRSRSPVQRSRCAAGGEIVRIDHHRRDAALRAPPAASPLDRPAQSS